MPKFDRALKMFKRIILFLRVQKPITKFCGPLFKRSRKLIEIDITYACDLRCINCNRSCRQAPSNEHMTIGQIKKFIEESKDNNVKWDRIRLLGGEPTLHPEILDILQLLLEYKKNYSLGTYIQLGTSGYGEKVNAILSKVPRGINILNTFKKSDIQWLCAFNIAPRDRLHYKFSDYSNGCDAISRCGIGLTPFGYYPCGIAGSIDRVFGFDLGRKKLPPQDDTMIDQLRIFCQYCGRFREGGWYFKRINKEVASSTWKEAYKKYKIKKPVLTPY